MVLENDDIYSDVKTPTLRINNDLRPADDAKYYCIVRDLSGNVRVTDKTKPGIIRTQSLRITQQPKDVAAKPGDFVNFIVTVTGGKAPYTYQWHKIRPDGGDIIPTGSAYYGLNEDTLQVKELSVGPDNNSKYYCVITDADGKTITSQTATLTIMMDPLAITQQPQALEILAGETAVFSVKVSGGSGSYDYRWNLSYDGHTYDLTDPAQYQRAKDEYKVFGGTFTGMNTDTLTYTNATADPWGYHVWCEITDRATGNTVESNFVSLDVYAPLAIAEPPHWVDAWITDNVSFTVTVTGGKAPYSYLWTSSMGHVKASSRMSNETSDTFEFILWGNEMDEEMFYCTVTDASGQSVKTNGARLDVHMGAY